MKLNIIILTLAAFIVVSAKANFIDLSYPLIKKESSKVIVKLENESVRISFISYKRNNHESVTPVFEVKTSSGWYKVPLEPSAESYQILVADTSMQMELYRWMYPKWRATADALDKDEDGYTKVIWEAGADYEYIAKKVIQIDKNRVLLEFYPNKIGILKAIWSLEPNAKTAKVEMQFTPVKTGQYSLGYFLFNSKPIEEVDELLMPMLVQRKRFPAENYTQLQASAPTPVSIMQTTIEGKQFSWGVAGEPTQIPYEFPIPIKSHYGLHIKNENGNVQPSIFGPLLGTEEAYVEAGKTLSFSFRVFVENGDWYSVYRDVADNVFGWYDYRKNGQVSMSQAVYNMIDLYMDDEYGGWWKRAQANYQIESKNGSTQATPLTIISLYLLTGDTTLYKKRTLPALEYLLSRNSQHFSPIPDSSGHYPKGHMNGPVNLFGSTVYAGLWEMTNFRTPVFKDIAFPDGGIKQTDVPKHFVPHIQPFDDLLGKYLFTGDQSALDSAIMLADKYIENEITNVPNQWISVNEFFLVAYTPAWEGLLRLYEVTGEQRFLYAAAKGARITMTGMWTQPIPKNDMVTIHKDGQIHGDKMDEWFYKGNKRFRLGFPIKSGAIKEKEVPEWLVSNVGLGFEQPSTYTFKDNGGRMILQANWSGNFLRLSQYTGDKQFETYARNAALGRMGNYAGYYYTTFTDMYQNPRYPYEGPDIGFIYYHHLPVHLSWTIDYLVGEAQLASDGEVSFPGLRQFGYAYFDNMVYGHKPGKIYGQNDVWLWFDKNLLKIDNSQINYLTAHTKDKFYVIMMNESQETQQIKVRFNPEHISKGGSSFNSASIITDKNATLKLVDNVANLEMDSREFLVLEVDGLNIELKVHQKYPVPKVAKEPCFAEIECEDSTFIRATSIKLHPGVWDAYIYSTAESKTLENITLIWETENHKGTLVDTDYPYEFSVPVVGGEDTFKFTIKMVKTNGKIIETKLTTIGAARN